MISILISLFALYVVAGLLWEEFGAFKTIVVMAASFYFLGVDGTLFAATSIAMLYLSYGVLCASIPSLFYAVLGCWHFARILVRI